MFSNKTGLLVEDFGQGENVGWPDKIPVYRMVAVAKIRLL
jgi:hypothetical protein